jgi:hypothetical protein
MQVISFLLHHFIQYAVIVVALSHEAVADHGHGNTRVFSAQDVPTLNATFSSGLGRVVEDSLKALGITLAFALVILLETCCIDQTKVLGETGSTSSLSAMRQPLLDDSEMMELSAAPATTDPLAAFPPSQDSLEQQKRLQPPDDDDL